MNNNRKIIFTCIITVLMFFISFVFFFNDVMNYFIVCSTCTMILFIYCCCLTFAKKDIKSLYIKRIKRILKTYDSILVYANSNFAIEDENIIFVKKFDNLLTAQEELNKPIFYIEEEKSSVFLLKDDKEILAFVDKEDEHTESKYENRLRFLIEDKNEKNDIDSKILEQLDKTTIIQLKNNKVYKVSPLKNE